MPRLDEREDELTDSREDPAVPRDLVAMFDGDCLRLEEASRLTERFDTKLIILVGDKDVGKTTLLAETHHSFLCGPLAGYRFAESSTLPGFERRCFEARTTSRGERADTLRTSLAAGVRLFHLAVQEDVDLAATRHFLIADVSGEAFKSMRHRAEDVDKFAPLFARADAVTFLVSGWRLASRKHAHHARTNSRTLLKVLLERGALTAGSIVQYGVTKWDCVVRSHQEDAVAQVFDDIQRQFSSRLRELTCHRIAARGGHDVKLERRFGLRELFGAWVAERSLDGRRPATIALPANARSYLRYGSEQVT